MKKQYETFEIDYINHNDVNNKLNHFKDQYLVINNLIQDINNIEDCQQEKINKIKKELRNVNENWVDSEKQANIWKKSTDKELKNLKYQIIFFLLLVLIFILLII